MTWSWLTLMRRFANARRGLAGSKPAGPSSISLSPCRLAGRWIRAPCDSSTMRSRSRLPGGTSNVEPITADQGPARQAGPTKTMFNLAEIQAALGQFQFDGWLIYDFRGSNLLARRIVGFPDDQMGSRRWFYFIPKTGSPRKLVHRIESSAL